MKKENEFLKSEERYLESHIRVIDDVISIDLCDLIIKEYSNSNQFYPAEISSGLNTNFRNCSILPISRKEIIELNSNVRKKIDNDIFLSVSKIFSFVNSKYQYIKITGDSGYELLKYDEGGFYKQHVDNSTKNDREISCSLLLNDNYEGGEFGFFDRQLKYKLKKGSAIIFPSNFMYPHEIMPITKGTRYSIITWFK